MQVLDGFVEAFEGRGDLLALIEVPDLPPEGFDFRGVGLGHHLRDDGAADVRGFDVADVAEFATVEPDFRGVVGDEAREEAVEGPEGQPLHREQGPPQEVPEEDGVTRVRELQAVAEFSGGFLAGGSLREFFQGLGDELRRSRPREGEGDDLLGLRTEGQELHDAVRQREGLARAGGGEDDLVVDGEIAHARVPPIWSRLR